ncbi:MAG: hypothetical protein ACK56I_06145, partial [bacterium]
ITEAFAHLRQAAPHALHHSGGLVGHHQAHLEALLGDAAAGVGDGGGEFAVLAGDGGEGGHQGHQARAQGESREGFQLEHDRESFSWATVAGLSGWGQCVWHSQHGEAGPEGQGHGAAG